MILMFVYFLFLIVNVNAAAEFPSGGTLQDQEEWISNNVDDFDPSNFLQVEAFRSAYENEVIRIINNNHRETIKNYLINQGTVELEDRGILEDYISFQIPGRIGVDLIKGKGISLTEENGVILLVSDDGQKHDIVNIGNILNLDKIESLEDGTIRLCFDNLCDNSISLKDTTLVQDTFGRLTLGDGTQFSLKENFGDLFIDGQKISCLSVKCSFSIGFLGFELNQNGFFQSAGINRFSVVDGKVEVGGDIISGSFEFSANAQRGGIDFTKKINLRAFLREGEIRLVNSFVETNTEAYGRVLVGTGPGERATSGGIRNVIACLGCGTDFIKHREQYGGYVDIKETFEGCFEFGTCGNFDSEIKGRVYVEFQKDASHFGFFEGLLLTYENRDFDESGFKLKSCEGCESGRVGLQFLNGNQLMIFNEIDENGRSFSVLRVNPVLSFEGEYSRDIYLIDDTGETKKTFIAKPDGTISYDTVTPQDIEDYREFSRLDSVRSSKALVILDKIPEESQKDFVQFVGAMKDGVDGHLVLAGEIQIRGIKIYPFGEGNYIAVRNLEVIRLLDEGIISIDDLIELSEANREVVVFERTKILKDVARAFVPESAGQIAFDIVTEIVTAGLGKPIGIGIAAITRSVSRDAVRKHLLRTVGDVDDFLLAGTRVSRSASDTTSNALRGNKEKIFDCLSSQNCIDNLKDNLVLSPLQSSVPGLYSPSIKDTMTNYMGDLARQLDIPLEELVLVGSNTKLIRGNKEVYPFLVQRFNPQTGEKVNVGFLDLYLGRFEVNDVGEIILATAKAEIITDVAALRRIEALGLSDYAFEGGFSFKFASTVGGKQRELEGAAMFRRIPGEGSPGAGGSLRDFENAIEQLDPPLSGLEKAQALALQIISNVVYLRVKNQKVSKLSD